MITWIESNLIGNPRATMGRPVAAYADHSPASWAGQMAAMIFVAALLVNAIIESMVTV